MVDFAGYLPNCVEAVEAMLAAASVGAVWSSTSPDFGVTVCTHTHSNYSSMNEVFPTDPVISRSSCNIKVKGSR